MIFNKFSEPTAHEKAFKARASEKLGYDQIHSRN